MTTIDPQKVYTFRQYFDQRVDPIDLAEYFGYSYAKQPLVLDQATTPGSDLTILQNSIGHSLPRILSSNEQTKREMFVSPIVRHLVTNTPAQIRIEYPLKVTEQLQGIVDYLLSVDNLSQLIVIEAKNDDLDYGASQLIAEMIALDQWKRSPSREAQPLLLGAVTMGSLWQFVTLDRAAKHLSQGVETFRVPEELETIVRILMYPLTQNQ